VSCSSGAREAGDGTLIVPEDLAVTALEGGNGVLELSALTLRAGPGGAELYAAVKNTGNLHACSAALSLELFDAGGRSLAAGIGGLLTRRFYRLTDGSGAIAACVGPGDVSMAAVTDWPSDLVVEDVASIVYRCPYFALDVEPIDGLSIEQVKSAVSDAGTVYSGKLVNGLDVSVRNPSVTIFPVNRAGRPLGAAIGSGTLEVPPGGSWMFEIEHADAVGVDYVAYPAGELGN
jgi:hypothetical protein